MKPPAIGQAVLLPNGTAKFEIRLLTITTNIRPSGGPKPELADRPNELKAHAAQVRVRVEREKSACVVFNDRLMPDATSVSSAARQTLPRPRTPEWVHLQDAAGVTWLVIACDTSSAWVAIMKCAASAIVTSEAPPIHVLSSSLARCIAG